MSRSTKGRGDNFLAGAASGHGDKGFGGWQFEKSGKRRVQLLCQASGFELAAHWRRSGYSVAGTSPKVKQCSESMRRCGQVTFSTALHTLAKHEHAERTGYSNLPEYVANHFRLPVLSSPRQNEGQLGQGRSQPTMWQTNLQESQIYAFLQVLRLIDTHSTTGRGIKSSHGLRE
jgi:hypothetical protein